jgi:hypothetical protein
MNSTLRPISVAALARHMVAIPQAFFGALIAPDAEIQATLQELGSELDGELPWQFGGVTIESWIAAAKADPSAVRLTTPANFTEQDWRALDARRSSVIGGAGLALVLSKDSFDALTRYAPHFSSCVATVFSKLDESGDSQIRDRRLAAIRVHTGKSDDDMLADAVGVRSMYEPIHAEWLTLLGRSDLLR